MGTTPKEQSLFCILFVDVRCNGFLIPFILYILFHRVNTLSIKRCSFLVIIP